MNFGLMLDYYWNKSFLNAQIELSGILGWLIELTCISGGIYVTIFFHIHAVFIGTNSYSVMMMVSQSR